MKYLVGTASFCGAFFSFCVPGSNAGGCWVAGGGSLTVQCIVVHEGMESSKPPSPLEDSSGVLARPAIGGSEGSWKRRSTAVCWKWLVCLSSFLLSTAGARAGQQHYTREKRSGDVVGLEEGRISLAKVSEMLTSSVHTEVGVLVHD